MEEEEKKRHQSNSRTPAETQQPVQFGPPGPGSALWEQSRVTAIAESSLAGMALVPAGGRGHAEKSPSTRAQRARSCPGRESAGILGILCVSQESAGICVNKHELDSHLLPVTRLLLLRSQPHPVKDELLNGQLGAPIICSHNRSEQALLALKAAKKTHCSIAMFKLKRVQ